MGLRADPGLRPTGLAHDLSATPGDAEEPEPAPSEISLRPATDADRDLLLAAYASTRALELAQVPWTDDEKARFVAMQFEAQDSWYRQLHPDGEFLVVLRDDVAIGRMYLSQLPDEIRIIDITLLPEHRGHGIGTRLLGDVLARADAAGLSVRLHVEPWNPALALYRRHGFRVLEERGIYLFLERPPGGQLKIAS